jgi:hypothetical protein
MTNFEFSNFFETFYLQEVKQSEQSEVRISQSGLMALRRAEFEHTGHTATGIEWLSLKPNCTQTILFECKTKE